jgi:hypothetical protein
MTAVIEKPSWWAPEAVELEMDSVLWAKWIERLRSDQDLQGSGSLAPIIKSGEAEIQQYCCLGVLCEVAEVDKKRHEHTGPKRNGEVAYYTYGVGDQSIVLPRDVADLVGLGTMDPTIPVIPRLPDNDNERYAGVKLSLLNDSGMPFRHIADLIEYFITPIHKEG